MDKVDTGTTVYFLDAVCSTKVTVNTDDIIQITTDDPVMTFTTQEHVISTTRLNQEIVIAGIAMQNIIAALAIDNVSIRAPFQGFANIGTFD